MNSPRSDRPTWGQPGDSVDRILDDWARERPDLDFAPVGVVTRLERVRAHLEAGMSEVFASHDLTAADFRVVVALRRAGSPYRLPQARLMTQLALTSGTVSTRIDRLVTRGVVTREPDPTDKRGVLVRLSSDGLTLFNEIAPLHLTNEDRMLSALTDEERTQLGDLLRRLLVSFESGTVDVGLPLGVRLEPAHRARARRTAVGLSDTPGLLVSDIIPGTPAADAGLARGDLLIAANATEIRGDAALIAAIRDCEPGGQLALSLLRGDEPHQVVLTVPAAERQPTTGRPSGGHQYPEP